MRKQVGFYQTSYDTFTFQIVVQNAQTPPTLVINDTGFPLQQIGKATKLHAGHVCHTDTTITTTIPVYTA